MIDLEAIKHILHGGVGNEDFALAFKLYVTGDSRDLDDKDEPTPMDTIGSLIDKLVTVDLKMWHNQEQLYAIRRMTTEEFTERYGGKLDELHAVVKRCCDLNVQRSRLVDAIDAKLAAAVAGNEALTFQAHKTY
jgi:hypothetical protein